MILEIVQSSAKYLIDAINAFDKPLEQYLSLEVSLTFKTPELDKARHDSQSSEQFFLLTSDQRTKLEIVVSMFPNFEDHCLGRTNLIKHEMNMHNPCLLCDQK